MRIGIYAPALPVYGGGEKYVCKIAEVLSQEHTVDLMAFEMPDRYTLRKRLNVNLDNVNMKALKLPPLVEKIPYIGRLAKCYILSKRSEEYDLFINQVLDMLFFPPARATRSIMIIAMPPTNLKKPPLFVNELINLFVDSSLSSYNKIIVYSFFVKKTVDRLYTKKSEVLYPPIDSNLGRPIAKERIILSVGRFFMGWHNKKQLEMIRAFKQLCDEVRLDEAHWEYHLIGGVLDDIHGQTYKKMCEQEASGYPIFFHLNAPFETVNDLYRRSTLFWHATGFDEDENKYPEKMEHFGIVTAEAMSFGCIPIVVGKGGQPEIVSNGINGVLWDTLEDLKEGTLKLINDPEKREKLSNGAIETSRQFQTDLFEIKVKQLFA
jgi:glycosyltransferase involved in cell wall biosynthesis